MTDPSLPGYTPEEIAAIDAQQLAERNEQLRTDLDSNDASVDNDRARISQNETDIAELQAKIEILLPQVN